MTPALQRSERPASLAALRALDHNELAPGRSTAPEATTHEENPT
jgi:hypothetical protein